MAAYRPTSAHLRGCQSDPRAWKAWNVYYLILYGKMCSLSLFSLSLKNGELLWSSGGGDDGIGALWSLGGWLNLLPVNPGNIKLFPSLWASLCSLCCPSTLRATNDPPCPQGLVMPLSCVFPTLFIFPPSSLLSLIYPNICSYFPARLQMVSYFLTYPTASCGYGLTTGQ